jgi:hypothetical protein
MPDGCKIRVLQNTVYTAHGMSTHSPTGLDAFALASTVLRSADPLSTVAATIAQRGVSPLSQALSSLRQTDPAAFNARSAARLQESSSRGTRLANLTLHLCDSSLLQAPTTGFGLFPRSVFARDLIAQMEGSLCGSLRPLTGLPFNVRVPAFGRKIFQ